MKRKQGLPKNQFFMLSILLMMFLVFVQCTVHHETATNIHLPLIFGDNMVLQQKAAVPIWGKADPGGTLTVQIAGRQKSTTVSDSGRWQVTLKTPKAGGPFVLRIIGRDTRAFQNVMFGEVWFASGQSNMHMAVSEALNADEEIAAADYPDIRLFQVGENISAAPVKEIKSAGWRPCSPETVPPFSATAYFFGRYLHQKLHVPVGLIHSSWGGTPAEAWMSEKALNAFPEFAKAVQNVKTSFDVVNYESHVQRYKKDIAVWEKTVGRILDNSATLKLDWQKAGFNDSGWKTMDLPAIWETRGLDVDGVVWFRKIINIPSSWRGQDVTLSLGPVNDFDVTWFNGKEVGWTPFYSTPRIYKIPASLVKKGVNVIAVEVLDVGNRGGFEGQEEQMVLINQDGDSLSLAGPWRYNVDPFYPNTDDIPAIPQAPLYQNFPTVLFNAMVAPFIPYSIRGVIWYQGENNADRAEQYRRLFPALIRDWRTHWGEGEFPFLFVQLPNVFAANPQPEEDEWAELREAQLMTLKSTPNTGMAVTIDIGEENNLHPKNKQEVGRRLALNAMRIAYGQDIECSGPLFKSMKIEGSKIRLFFDHVDGGLVFKRPAVAKFPGAGDGFAIAGADHKFVWADAVIDGETILVSSPQVVQPVAVRYAWAGNPVCNLYNKAGLPASPFRTDSWPGLTAGKK